VRVKVAETKTTVSLVVENSGEIPAATMERLFDPFREQRPSRTRKEGLGLGMYIVHQLVTAHGGTLDVTSREGVTTVRATFPR
jgi:two-component system sensor histidine kinase/response regulator